MFSKDKIISYQLVGEEFNNVQKELEQFYNLDIPYANPFDTKDPESRIPYPRLDVSYATFNYSVIRMHNLTKLGDAIIMHSPNKNCMIGENWATDMKIGSISDAHTHINYSEDTFFCGVYYYDVDQSDVNIQFLIDDIWVDFDMRPGKLMYWPTNYFHRIPMKTSNVTRRSFSFNLYKFI
jgi:hypothetical protein